MASLRDFWKAEADKLRDTSHLLDKLDYQNNPKITDPENYFGITRPIDQMTYSLVFIKGSDAELKEQYEKAARNADNRVYLVQADGIAVNGIVPAIAKAKGDIAMQIKNENPDYYRHFDRIYVNNIKIDRKKVEAHHITIRHIHFVGHGQYDMELSVLYGNTRIDGFNDLNNIAVKQSMKSVGRLITGAIFFHSCAGAGSRPSKTPNSYDDGMRFVEKLATNFSRPVWASKSWVPALEYAFGEFEKQMTHKYKENGKEIEIKVEHFIHPPDSLGFDGWLDYYKRNGSKPYPEEKGDPETWYLTGKMEETKLLDNYNNKYNSKKVFEDRKKGSIESKKQAGKWVHATYSGGSFKSYIVNRIKIYPNGLIRDKSGKDYWH